jgi:phage terminase large subunit
MTPEKNSNNDNPFIKLMMRYRDDPVAFAQQVIGIEPDEWQVELLDAVAAPAIRRISVRSGHGVGKSTGVAMAAIWHVLMRYPSKTVVTAPTSSQLFDALFAEMKNIAKRLKPPFNNLLEIKADRIELKSSPESTFISCRTSRAEQPEALAGVHSENVLLLADEASGVPEAVFEAASGSMSGHNATTVLTGNPTRNTGFFYETHNRLKDDWYTMHVSCVTSPRVSDDYVEDMKKRYGEDSPAYHVRVLGNFPPSEEDTVIPVALIDHAMHNDIKIHEDTRAIWGLDVARQGGDASVLAKRQGPVIHPLTVWRNLDLMQLSGAVKAEYDSLAPSKRPIEIIVDSNGFGAGVLDRLRELGLPARGLNVSERAMSKDTYLNLRAELWFKAKGWLEGMDVSLPMDDALWAELAAPRYQFTSSGKIQVESKESMKKRGVPSPDRADAVCLCLADDHTTLAYGSAGGNAWSQPLKRSIRGVV